MKAQLNIRISDSTREKLDQLTERYGTQAEAIAVAIDRLYREEQTMGKRAITVRIHRQDTVDWLDGNTDLADRYMAEVSRRMAEDLHASVTVEDGYLVGGGDSGVSYDSAVDDGEMREAQDSYEAICADLSNDWSWAK